MSKRKTRRPGSKFQPIVAKVKIKWWTKIAGGALGTLGKLLPCRWQWRIFFWIQEHGIKIEGKRK